MALSERQKFLFEMMEKNSKSYSGLYKKYHESLSEVSIYESEKLRNEMDEYRKVVISCYEELRKLVKLRRI
jgi:hypothetical protein